MDEDLLMPSGPTYIDNGDGTCRVEYPVAGFMRWTGGGPITALPPTRRQRLAAWWLSVRTWIAEKVLRVPVGDFW